MRTRSRCWQSRSRATRRRRARLRRAARNSWRLDWRPEARGSVAGFDGVATRIFEAHAVGFVGVVDGCGFLVHDFLRSRLILGLHGGCGRRREAGFGLRDGNLVGCGLRVSACRWSSRRLRSRRSARRRRKACWRCCPRLRNSSFCDRAKCVDAGHDWLPPAGERHLGNARLAPRERAIDLTGVRAVSDGNTAWGAGYAVGLLTRSVYGARAREPAVHRPRRKVKVCALGGVPDRRSLHRGRLVSLTCETYN